jgi:predicted double-glycine peptidase
MQKYDFSCGVSSLLTLFKYHFGNDNLNEKGVLSKFLDSLSEKEKKEVLEKGLSVLDLKTLSEDLGYKVYAVVLKKESLLKIDRPILVYLETKDYKHFSVLRGIKDDTVFLADSSYGKTRMSIPAFLKMWKGNVAIFLDAPQSRASKLKILEEELQKPEIRLLQNVL